jgi:hypothetical protein
LGNKKMLEQQIHEVTGIPITALHGAPLSHFSVDERLQWAEKRNTARKEDKAYCLLGVLMSSCLSHMVRGRTRSNGFKRRSISLHVSN